MQDAAWVGLRVINAGLGRTGTTSLFEALEQLGFGPVYHGLHHHPEHIKLWEAAADGRPIDWDQIFLGYGCVKEPSALFYQQLMAAYPRAKVILTTRDPDRWYESVKSTIYRWYRVAYFPPFKLLWSMFPRWRRTRRILERLLIQEMFGGSAEHFEDRDRAIAAFHRHNADVTASVPAERLLVYDVKQGWGPLCAFLGVDVPAGRPFPRKLAKGGFFREVFVRNAGRRRPLRTGLVLATIVALASVLWRRVRAG